MPFNKHALITTEEAAKYLGLKKNTLEKYRSIGNMGPKYHRVGATAIRYKIIEIDEWVESCSPNESCFE